MDSQELYYYGTKIKSREEATMFFQSIGLYFPKFPCFSRSFSQMVYIGEKNVSFSLLFTIVSSF